MIRVESKLLRLPHSEIGMARFVRSAQLAHAASPVISSSNDLRHRCVLNSVAAGVRYELD